MKTIINQIADRATKPTPKFFRTLRLVGILVASASAILASAPFAVPAALLWALGSVGTTVSIVSQLTVDDTVIPESIHTNSQP